MVSVNDADYWDKRYQQGTTGWDLGTAAPAFTSLLRSCAAPPPGKVAVLGCGRGYDALLFQKSGFEVVGFDFAASAINDALTLAKVCGSSATFLQRNIFDLPGEFASYFDYLVEHTCFCAIEPINRPAYVEVAKSILNRQGELIGLFFTHNRPGGPPFGVTPAEIRQYFSQDFDILCLDPVTNSVPERQGQEHLGRFRARG
ncbi:MAG: methyltransferase domain-containing protein [Nostocaceae cyanobacterium]|nr:methyltransferase domain-containing protein [Nostocaceae cyanobacterium]